MIQIELNKLSIEDKLKIIEMLWNNLLQTEEDVPSPMWHKDELFIREKSVKNHQEIVLNWKDTKKDIMQLINGNKDT